MYLHLSLEFLSLFIILVTRADDPDTDNFFVDINLPENHLSPFFNNLPGLEDKFINSNSDFYKEFLNSDRYERDVCWGYEHECKKPRISHKCPGNHTGYVQSKEAQLDVFYAQADFGYVKQYQKELTVYCEPTFVTDSSLECSQYVRFCRGRNIMLNFTDLIKRTEPLRYNIDVLKQGEIGGYCKLKEEKLKEQLDHVSALQSWAPELRFFESLTQRPIESGICDVVIHKPTFIMKIDATGNMYHHFCDFFNLYASQHLNFTNPHAFSTDINILIWESYPYSSPFSQTFDAFTENPLMDLNTFRGQSVCFKNLVLPLLPRMIFGLFYNTPIIYGCENSALFNAFSEHILHRLDVKHEAVPKTPKLRITFLSRDTQYRKVLNEAALLKRITSNELYQVKKVSYGRNLSFKEQLRITRNSDIFVGMHGAGLTHLLFLPSWASLFELYNCEDPNCYKDLARLRGVNYVTWENETLVEHIDANYKDLNHAKFQNYNFDVAEFERLVKIAAESVQKHPDYLKHISQANSRDEL